MRAYRIGAARFAGTPAEAFSGRGSLVGDGRWHHAGRLAVYVAQHASLATLEVLVHLKRVSDIQPYVMYAVEVPDKEIMTPADLPRNWQKNIEASRTYGDRWLATGRSAALRVPSVLVPSEFNLLLNPVHRAFSLRWIVSGPDSVTFDPRLLR